MFVQDVRRAAGGRQGNRKRQRVWTRKTGQNATGEGSRGKTALGKTRKRRGDNETPEIGYTWGDK